MTNNKKLVGLSLTDFSKLHSLDGIEKAGNLAYFRIGNRVEARMEIESFKPIVDTEIKHFAWGGKCVRDNDFGCLADSKIEELDICSTQFTMLELAQLLALFPETLKGSITKPYTKGGIKDKDGYTEYFFLCKRKKTCVKGRDDEVYRFCQNAYMYFKDKEYSDILHTIGIAPVAAPQELYDDGAWKESVKLISNKSCAIISIRMDFQEYYNADSAEKIILTKREKIQYITNFRRESSMDIPSGKRILFL